MDVWLWSSFIQLIISQFDFFHWIYLNCLSLETHLIFWFLSPLKSNLLSKLFLADENWKQFNNSFGLYLCFWFLNWILTQLISIVSLLFGIHSTLFWLYPGFWSVQKLSTWSCVSCLMISLSCLVAPSCDVNLSFIIVKSISRACNEIIYLLLYTSSNLLLQL